LKIFVCEFVTGGGLYRELLPASLLREGALMRDAVLQDLSQLENVQVTMTCDVRVSVPLNAECISIEPSQDIWSVWHNAMQEADMVWLIAPETDGVLEKLTLIAESLGKPTLGCSSSAIKLAADKWDTYQLFKAFDIPTPNAFRDASFIRGQSGPWVAKLIDGVACENSRYFESEDALIAWMQDKQDSHFVQQYQLGSAASFSMLCYSGQAVVVSCNQQKIELQDGQFKYTGSLVNGLLEHLNAFQLLATKIVGALPGLSAYVGVDLIVYHDGDAWRYSVLEINPRLTTSYVGLHQACGLNPAQLILDMFYNKVLHVPAISFNKVDVSTNGSSNVSKSF
jgi:predicted ATP-grasp superfamily ATP-dependent carboligase